MRKLFTLLLAVLLTASVFAQAPQKMSYQAVIRNTGGTLVTSTQIGMEINIRQGSPTGTVVYTETQTPTTNTNGLVSIEIGGGTGFSTINWASDNFYIETKTAVVAPLTTYTITGVSQLLSVPYALNAKTAESITGTITETDPVFTSSQAANITANDITKLSNLSGTNTGDQDLTGLATTTAVATALATKVDKEAGKGLSTNDYTTVEQSKLAAITGTNTGDQDLSGLATTTAVTTALDLKVDKETGKGLSTNDYTTVEQSKLAAITGTNTGDQDLSGLATTTSVSTSLDGKVDKVAGKGLSTEDYTTAEKTKLTAITGTNTGDQDLTGLATTSAVTIGLATKVDKEAGKGLSTNDYTTVEQTKLAAITGTNTGDNATNTQYSGLNAAKANLSGATFTGAISATNLSGSNTGDQTLPTLVSLGAVASNTAITAGSNTKITYDTKGLVTAGSAATTADIAASTNRNYVTDAQKIVIGNMPALTIGQSYQGGKIFWLDASGQHGLIAATADQSTNNSMLWSNGQSKYTGSTGDGLYAGAMNTAMIVATQIADNPTGSFAAKVCADYSVTDAGVTYGDWYLPSEYEMSLLYLQRAWFGNFPGGFWYWSSTESSSTQALILNLESGGGQSFGSKNLGASVRAIRAF